MKLSELGLPSSIEPEIEKNNPGEFIPGRVMQEHRES